MDTPDRQKIIDHLLDRMVSTSQGHPKYKASLISGTRGVGKSMLVRRFLDENIAKKRLVVDVVCRHGDDRPHGPMIDCLNGLVAATNLSIDQLPSTRRALERLSGLSVKPTASFGSLNSTAYLSENIRQAMLELSSKFHFCIVIQDVHKTESTTGKIAVRLLEDLLADSVFEWGDIEKSREPDESGMHGAFVLFTFRPTPHLKRLLTLAETSQAIEHIELEPLDLAGVKQYLSEDSVAKLFLKRSGGLPLRIEQMISSITIDSEEFIFTIKKKLTKPVSDRLNALAVAGTPCTPRQLDELLDDKHSTQQLFSELNRLVVTSFEQGRPIIKFRREAEREAWYEMMPAEIKLGLHGTIAERLAAGLYAQPETIARHFLGAERPGDALPFVMEAIPNLERVQAHARAIELLESISSASVGELQEQVLRKLYACYSATGQYDECESVLNKLEQTGFTDTTSLFVLSLKNQIHARRIEDFHEMSESLSALPDSEEIRECRALLAEAALREGHLEQAFELCQVIDRNVAPANQTEQDLRNTLGKVFLFREAFDEAETHFLDNLRWARKLEHSQHQAKALINLGVVYLQQGRIDAALNRFDEARQVSLVEGDITLLAVALENLAVLYYRKQDYRSALFHYHKSAATSRRLGRHDQFSTTILNLGDLYLTVGDLVKCRRLTVIARNYIERNRYRTLEPQLWTLEGDIARFEGDYETAKKFYTTAESLIRKGSITNQRLIPLLLAWAELHLGHNQLDEARVKLDDALEMVSSMHEGLALRLRITQGSILSEQGDLNKARLELDSAVHGARQRQDLEACWLARTRLGLTLWRLGDEAGAAQQFEDATKDTHHLVSKLPDRLKRLYLERPNQRLLAQHIQRLRDGLAPAGQLAAKTSKGNAASTTHYYQPDWVTKYPRILGRSQKLSSVLSVLDRIAGSEGMVLITGESGTGKELVAEALHHHSPRREKPFVKVNCAAFVETLLLSELFGHEKGAFTGASGSKKGRFELADGGTLFLDEIGDISPNTQVALLRVLQEGTLDRVGGTTTVSVDVRVICATHRNLEQMVAEGTFRMDLYYRLRGVTIELPPLRERIEDIPILASHFLGAANQNYQGLSISQEALASLLEHDWPGNVRELENVVRSAALFAQSASVELEDLIALGKVFRPPSSEAMNLAVSLLAEAPNSIGKLGMSSDVQAENKPTELPYNGSPQQTVQGLLEGVQAAGGLAEYKKKVEFDAIAYTLNETKGNITQAADRLGMKRPRLSQIISAEPRLAELKEKYSK